MNTGIYIYICINIPVDVVDIPVFIGFYTSQVVSRISEPYCLPVFENSLRLCVIAAQQFVGYRIVTAYKRLMFPTVAGPLISRLLPGIH